jgi:hypothetical protein
VAVRDTGAHQRFHDGLSEMARRIYAPEATPEEWAQAVREEAERQAGTTRTRQESEQ